MPEGEDKKTPTEKAMEKDCIVLVAGSFILKAVSKDWAAEIDVKCLGPACGQYAEFVSKCGFSK